MTTLTDKFTALETQINDDANEAHSQRATIESTLEDIQAGIASINSDMLLMQRALLQGIGQSAACFPCPTPSIVVPPVATTPFPVNSANCQRAQGLIATIHAILAAMDTLQSFNVVGSFSVINDAISQVIATITAGDTIPLPSFPETVNIVGDYISYAGERLFSGVGLIDQFAPLETSLIGAIWSAGTPDSAQAAYNASIDGSSASNGAKLLFKAIAYTALWSYYFDPASLPDVSGFDGSVCAIAPGTCFERTLHLYSRSGGGSGYGIDEPFGPFTAIATVGSTSGPFTFTPAVFYLGNIAGWTVEALAGDGYMTYRTDDPSASTAYTNTGEFFVGADPYVLPTTSFFAFVAVTSGVVLRLCSPSE